MWQGLKAGFHERYICRWYSWSEKQISFLWRGLREWVTELGLSTFLLDCFWRCLMWKRMSSLFKAVWSVCKTVGESFHVKSNPNNGWIWSGHWYFQKKWKLATCKSFFLISWWMINNNWLCLHRAVNISRSRFSRSRLTVHTDRHRALQRRRCEHSRNVLRSNA